MYEMDQSLPVRSRRVFHSPLIVDECRERLENRTERPLPWGVWLQPAGGGPELNGTIQGSRVRLIRPHVKNDALRSWSEPSRPFRTAAPFSPLESDERRDGYLRLPANEGLQYLTEKLGQVCDLARVDDS
jgi:hypothetical protein